jgi:hypothetical protein
MVSLALKRDGNKTSQPSAFREVYSNGELSTL